MAADQTEQPVDLAHLGPGQRVVQQRGGVGADMLAVPGGASGQGVQVAHGVGGHLAGQVGRVGAPASGFLAGVDFDQLASAVQLHRARVGAGEQSLSDQLPGN